MKATLWNNVKHYYRQSDSTEAHIDKEERLFLTLYGEEGSEYYSTIVKENEITIKIVTIKDWMRLRKLVIDKYDCCLIEG